MCEELLKSKAITRKATLLVAFGCTSVPLQEDLEVETLFYFLDL